MRVVALISGGKDSCFNMMHCVAQGHEIVALANLKPQSEDELDSYMFQTVGHHVIELYAEALALPLYRRTISGTSLCLNASYEKSTGDEVEDLYELLKDIRDDIHFDAVSSGAILSNYQRVRVENVCTRLGIQSLAYLWQRDQVDLLEEMIQAEVNAILIKVASLGLEPQKHLGKSLKEMQSHLLKMKAKFQLNVCGEGGEYETMTLDCPLFLKKIVIDEEELVIHSDDAFAPVGYLSFKKMHLVDKNIDPVTTLVQRMKLLKIPELLGTDILDNLNGLEMESECTENTSKAACISRASGKKEDTTLNIHTYEDKTWITEIKCVCNDGETIEESTKKTMDNLKSSVEKNGFKMMDTTLVNLFCADMTHFSNINSVYKTYFNINPPARVCVEVPLPKHILFKMDILLHVAVSKQRDALHVQSISYWAPANIGPYSQAVKIDRNIYFSGSIGMNPSTMQVVTYSFVKEAYLALQHVGKVSKVITPLCEADEYIGCVTCYVIHKFYIPVVRALFKIQKLFGSKKYILNILVVPHLPRNARVEWHVVSSSMTKRNNSVEEHVNIETELYQLNAHHLSIKVLNSDFQSDLRSTLVSIISQNYQRLEECGSFRVFYILGHHIINENSFCKAFHSAFQSTMKYKAAMSFIPVDGGPSADVVALICGQYHQREMEDDDET